MRLSSLVAVFMAAVLVSACQSKKIDNSMLVNPDPGVSFSADVLPIFTASCAGSGCHVGQSTNGVNVSSHAQVMASTGAQYGGAIVAAGDGAGSPLIDKLGPSPAHGSRMPLGAGPLSSGDIATIRTWIDEGAEDN